MAKGKVSFNPDDAVTGGGLISDFDGKIVKGVFREFTYPGKGTQANVFTLTIETDAQEDPVEENYTIGTGWSIGDDGNRIEGNDALNKSCKLNMFIEKLVKDCHYPKDKLSDTADQFNGMEGHFFRSEVGERKGLVRDRKYPEQVLVMTEITKFPWDKKGAKSTGTSKAKEKEVEPEENGLSERAVSEVMELLSSKEGKKGMKKKDLAAKVYDVLKGDKELPTGDRSSIVKMIYDDEWLSDKPWEFDPKSGLVGG